MLRYVNYQRTATEIVIAVGGQVVVDVGKTTIVGVTAIQLVAVLEYMRSSISWHYGSITLTTAFYVVLLWTPDART